MSTKIRKKMDDTVGEHIHITMVDGSEADGYNLDYLSAVNSEDGFATICFETEDGEQAIFDETEIDDIRTINDGKTREMKFKKIYKLSDIIK